MIPEVEHNPVMFAVQTPFTGPVIDPTMPLEARIRLEIDPGTGAFPPLEVKLIDVVVDETTVATEPVPRLPPVGPVPFVAVIIVPAGIDTPVKPVIVPLQTPFNGPVILPTIGVPLIAGVQNMVEFENGMFEAAGSIGITLRLTLKVCGVSVVLVKDRLGFNNVALEITEVAFVAGFVIVQT